MKVMLLLSGDEAIWAAKTPEEVARDVQPYMAYTQALRDAGKLVHADRLAPSMTARTVLTGGERIVDGPYAETKEQLGGYYLIEVADMDEAVEWARRCPQVTDGVVEIRPIFEHD